MSTRLDESRCVLALTAFRDGCSVAEVLQEEDEEFSSNEARSALYALGAMIDRRRFLAKHEPVELHLETADGEAVVFSFPPLEQPRELEPAAPVPAPSSSPPSSRRSSEELARPAGTPSRHLPSSGSPPSQQQIRSSRSPPPSRTPPPRASPRLRSKAARGSGSDDSTCRKRKQRVADAAPDAPRALLPSLSKAESKA